MRTAIIARRLARRAEEAQNSVALAEGPRAGERAVAVSQLDTAAVLGHDPGFRREQAGAAEPAGRARVLFGGPVGRVEENDVEPHAAPLEPAQPRQHIEGKNLGAGLDF